jgi:hypothetical protein
MDKPFDSVNFCLDYESDRLNVEQIIYGFQKLIDCGLVWKLQGSYGRMANDLIRAGYCHGTSLTGLAKAREMKPFDMSTEEGREASGMWDFGPDD